MGSRRADKQRAVVLGNVGDGNSRLGADPAHEQTHVVFKNRSFGSLARLQGVTASVFQLPCNRPNVQVLPVVILIEGHGNAIANDLAESGEFARHGRQNRYMCGGIIRRWDGTGRHGIATLGRHP
jgi:hypothetical protein